MTSNMWTVTKLNFYLKNKLDADDFLRNILVQGEISNFTAHTSGHWYFTLKDEKARVSCVMFASQVKKCGIFPKNGEKVIVKGNISLFEATGQCQLYATGMQLDGIGNLHLEFERLKNQLAAEGLFDVSKKKTLPKYPAKIGIISGEATAALHDIKITIARRWPICELVEYHCLVQGLEAKNQITHALEKADSENLDVIIIARGGGSLEDLWPFNEEVVARCIFNCSTPIVTGIGHEIDFTICDYVADVRAATPTAAAELVTPDIEEIKRKIAVQKNKLQYIVETKTQSQILRLEYYNQKLVNVVNAFTTKRHQLQLKEQYLVQLSKQSLQKYVVLNNYYREKTTQLVTQTYSESKLRLKNRIDILAALNPLAILKRGYSIISDSENVPIRSIKDIEVDEDIKLKLHDGQITARVLEREEIA